jgi:hypothetical protein
MMHPCKPATTERPDRKSGDGVAWVHFLLCGVAAMLTPATLVGQTSSAAPPAKPAGTQAVAPSQAVPPKKLDNKEIAQRPYNAVFTKPQYPSTAVQQKQFTIQYVYNYAESTYTPAVPLPTVARASAKFNTPENALIALYSAMRSADFEGFLNCWDEASRAGFEAQSKSSPQYKQKLLANWKTIVADKPAVLTHRLDTVNYVILDAVIQNAFGPGKPFDDSEVLVFEKGRWVLSNQFQTDGLITQHDLKAKGDKVTYDFDLRPLLPEGGAGTAANHAQEEFLKAHNKMSTVTETVE